MKIRKGFVSNSSSSSFIIGIGKVVNFREAQKIIDKHKYDAPKILSTQQIIDLANGGWSHFNIYEDKLEMTVEWASRGGYVEIPFDKQGNDYYLVVDKYPHDGDQYFTQEDDWYCNYDIDKDFFDKEDQELIDLQQTGIVSDYSASFGAGRNG
jgi:hypothetical protein